MRLEWKKISACFVLPEWMEMRFIAHRNRRMILLSEMDVRYEEKVVPSFGRTEMINARVWRTHPR